MKISMYTMSVETLAPMLRNLVKILEKGEAHAAAKKFDAAVLINARLAPDMFPLSKQVQIACDGAKFGVARLSGSEAPKFEDNEKSFEELKTRIQRTVDFIASVAPASFEGSEDRDIKIPMRDRTLEMKGLPYLKGWVLPNVFFHITTAYAILRHNGVDLGKGDYLGS
ncbi:MAG TPA: DUF1993 domain-containing protein [Steroidobacteraceae bacterium]|nr:DUF1993 domain-containing protein [Steroidobacteraceae bacterium]